MKSTYKKYEPKDSLERIDDILKTQDNNFEEYTYIPDLSKITYTNGYYIDCSVICCDIRKSTSLYAVHTRPIIAKLIRSFISEVVALLTDNLKTKEIFIEGDCVWGVIDTPKKDHIEELFNTSSKINSMMKFLNYKLEKRGITKIDAGIGLSYGRVLVVKAGYSGSGINELVWLGPAVGEAHELAGYGNQVGKKPIYLSSDFHFNLNEDSKKFCEKSFIPDAYGANVIWKEYQTYYEENCK